MGDGPKPGANIWSTCSPAGRFANPYRPAMFVVVVISVCPDWVETITTADRTAAPVASSTIPETPPVALCAGDELNMATGSAMPSEQIKTHRIAWVVTGWRLVDEFNMDLNLLS